MTDLDDMEKKALAVKGWGNCDQAWLDTSEDDSAAVVGHIDEDGETYPVITVDCDQYYAGGDSLPLAKFYAAANTSAILDLIARCRKAEARVAELEEQSGEAVARFNWNKGEFEWLTAYSYEKHHMKPLYLRAPQAVPEGWKLVPIEPTLEQMKAGACWEHPIQVYKAMLAATPSPEGENHGV